MMQLMYLASFATSLISRDIFLFLDSLNINLSFFISIKIYNLQITK